MRESSSTGRSAAKLSGLILAAITQRDPPTRTGCLMFCASDVVSRPMSVTFEIGAGTGTATRRLLELGANPLIAVEPDDRLATFLRGTIQDKALTVLTASFEEAALPEASFDLGVSATAFHWLTEELALTKVAKLLRPGGWWATVWNVFGDSHRPDPFHEATKVLAQRSFEPFGGRRGNTFRSRC